MLPHAKFLGVFILFILIAPRLGNQPGTASPNIGIITELAPMAYTTLAGATGGQPVSNLTSKEESGVMDVPTHYVSFTTPGVAYSGYRSFFTPVPSNLNMSVRVNYKGPAVITQTWTWSLYRWSSNTWVSIGNNKAVPANTWTMLTFNVRNPQDFVRASTGEIRLLLRSNNANGDAKLDYESISITPARSPKFFGTTTPSPTRTSTITPTPTITLTRTLTPTPTATPTSARFAIVGDYGVDNINEADVAMLIKSWNPDFIVTVGDNNYFSGDSSTIDQNIGKYYHEFIYPYANVNGYGTGSPGTNRFFPSLGNHDWDSPNGAQPYTDYFNLPGNERYYDFGWGPIHFFILDSDTREPDGTSSSSTQGLWLQNRLAVVSEPWKLVFMHHPPYSSSVHGSTPYMQWDYQGWGASAVFAGHDHAYERIVLGGFPYFVDGLGGQSRYSFSTPVAGSEVRYNNQFGAMLVNATATQITFQFIDIDGTIFDSYELTKP